MAPFSLATRRAILRRLPLPTRWQLDSAGVGARLRFGAEVFGPGAIHVGDRVLLSARCRLHAWTPTDEIVIGDACEVSPYAQLLSYGGWIRLGRNCTVHEFSVLYGQGGLEIGDNVRIAAHVVMIPENHAFDDVSRPIYEQGLTRRGIVIEDDVWVGAGVRILDGVRVGKGSVLAAGAVVTRDVAPLSVMGGVPARLIRRRGETG